MQTEYTCLSYGYCLRIETGTPERLEELIRWLPPHKVCDGDANTPHAVLRVEFPTGQFDDLRLSLNGEPVEPESGLSGLHLFESKTKMTVAELSPDFVFVHAGVVGWRGRAIIIPAVSYAGKTTLVAALISAGADYLSDEYAALDGAGNVHPFARPLMIRQNGRRHWREPHDFGAKLEANALPPGLILSTNYEREATWAPTELSPGQAVLQLLRNTVSARFASQRALSSCRMAAERCVCWSGPRGSADETAAAILESFDDHLTLTESHAHAPQTTND